MRKLRVEWSYDESDCDTCGFNYSTGCVIYLDDELLLDAPASASCFGGPNITELDVLQILCDKLEIELEVVD